MRNFSLLLALFFSTYSFANAQITVTNASFPKIGDTLRTSNATTPKGFTVAKDGIGKTWDFSTLKSTAVNTTLILAAKEGTNSADFPKATLVEKRLATGDEYYMKVNGTSYETIGYAGSNATGFAVASVTKVSPAVVNRRSPMAFFDLNNTNSAINAAVPLTGLPDSIVKQIGQFAGLIDSIRVKYVSTRTDLVNGYGTVKIPMGSYEVLREQRVQYNDKKLEVHTKLFKTWSDITTLIPTNQLPAGIKSFIGLDTSFQYHFFSNKQKEVIAIATMDNKDNTKVTAVTYKNVNKFTPVIDNFGASNFARPDIRAFPNPANDEVNIEMMNFETGNYTLKIYNLLGAVIMQDNYTLAGTKTIKLDITQLRKGTYLYSISNSQGKMLVTKRLMVLKA
jgi:hypothetical protein